MVTSSLKVVIEDGLDTLAADPQATADAFEEAIATELAIPGGDVVVTALTFTDATGATRTMTLDRRLQSSAVEVDFYVRSEAQVEDSMAAVQALAEDGGRSLEKTMEVSMQSHFPDAPALVVGSIEVAEPQALPLSSVVDRAGFSPGQVAGVCAGSVALLLLGFSGTRTVRNRYAIKPTSNASNAGPTIESTESQPGAISSDAPIGPTGVPLVVEAPGVGGCDDSTVTGGRWASQRRADYSDIM